MRKSHLLIDDSGLLTRAAICRDGRPVGFWHGAVNRAVLCAGQIYAAHISNVDTRLGGAFLDLGQGQRAFLPLSPSQTLSEGTFILVQIKRPPVEQKRALATTRLQFTSPLMTWQPHKGRLKITGTPYLTDVEDKANLTQALGALHGDLTLHALAQGARVAQLVHDTKRLQTQYQEAQSALARKTPGLCLVPLSTPEIVLSSFAHFTPDCISTQSTTLKIQTEELCRVMLSHHPVQIDMPAKPGCLFDDYGVEESLDRAFEPEMTLDSGTRLHFSSSPALTSIDVDVATTAGQSKRAAIMKASSDAVPVIFDQLVLRGIGGQVVIDFPGLVGKSHGQILSVIKQAARRFPGCRLGRFSPSGLFDFTLPQFGGTLLDRFTEPQGTGPIPGRVWTDDWQADRALRLAVRHLAAEPARKFQLVASARLVRYLQQAPHWRDALTVQYGPRLELVAGTTDQVKSYDIVPL